MCATNLVEEHKMGKLTTNSDEGGRNEKGSLRRISRAKQKRLTDKLLQTSAVRTDNSHFDSEHNHFTSSDIARQCNLEMT
jgi:hypothetical protein